VIVARRWCAGLALGARLGWALAYETRYSLLAYYRAISSNKPNNRE
jgi:hypothetical protein